MIDSETFVNGATAEEYSAPLFIAWQLNSECNLNCLHCCEEAGTEFPDALSRDERLDFCQQCVDARVPYVALSGGEPMMCPDFWDICEFLRSHQVDVKVETNGEMIGPDEVKRFAQLKLRSVQISLDGATQQCHEALRENGDWNTVIQACELLRNADVSTEIVFVPTKFNIHEVGDAVDRAFSLGAAGFYTGKLMRIGRAAQNWDTLCPTDEQYDGFFETLKQKTDKYKGRMKVYCYPYDVIEELKYRLDQPAASLLVIPNGKVKLIGPLPFLCGDLRESSLMEIWERYKTSWQDKRVRDFAEQLIEQPTMLAEANTWVAL
jgi:MoaA/NifB/PqqE/SkfB family radical SAM enzyme